MKFRIRIRLDWRRLLLLYWLVVAYLMLVASITRAAPLSEADKERERVRVAIEIARARLHPKPVPVVVPTPEVVVSPPFTQGGTRTLARHVGGLSTASTGIYREDDIPIGAPTTAPYGVIRGCVSYG